MSIKTIYTTSLYLVQKNCISILCFTGGVVGGGDTKDVEKHAPEGGTDNPAVNHNSSEYIQTTPELKKPKEDTPV